MPSLPTAANTCRGGKQVTPHAHAWEEQAILFAACGMLAFGVLALGAVQEWAVCALECGAALLFALWAGHQLALERIRLSTNAGRKYSK